MSNIYFNLPSRQRGQSAVEFSLALLVLAPLYLAIHYAERYSDIMQTAVTASRYSAFQRIIQPDPSQLTDLKIEDQMRARFFRTETSDYSDQIRSDDTAVQKEKTGTPLLWKDLSSRPLLSSTDKVTLKFRSESLPSNLASGFAKAMAASAGLTYGEAGVADVEVTLENRLDLVSANPAPIVIASSTALVADALGSSGSAATRKAAAVAVPPAYIPKEVATVFEKVMYLFEPSGPILGCIKPDVVPSDRLEGYPDGGSCR